VLRENEKAVEEFRSGKEAVLMFLYGQVMKKLPVKIDPQILKSALLAQLKEF
jgi:Asp-tRNA(Asn)/Glu-tRNA(Gln) amidotransferase B subunit